MSRHAEIEWRERCANPAHASWMRPAPVRTTARQRTHRATWFALAVAVAGFLTLVHFGA